MRSVVDDGSRPSSRGEPRMAEWLYDRSGIARIILDDDRIRNKRGNVIAWISGSNVYSLHGRHIGWFDGGVIYDSRNCAVLSGNYGSGNSGNSGRCRRVLNDGWLLVR
jgi:hypothetical protein